MVHPRSLKDEIWLQTFKIGKLRLLDINNATLFSYKNKMHSEVYYEKVYDMFTQIEDQREEWL